MSNLLLDKDNKLVGFGIVTPSYAKALQKMKGKVISFWDSSFITC